MPKIAPFEEYSDKYDQWFERNCDTYHAELEAIRQVMPPPPARGLEVGVGSGKFAHPLGIKIGVEPSKKMAVKAESLGIRIFQHAAERLPFSESEFDFVLMVTTICFVDDILETFREAWRVLKPDGCIIVGFVDKNSKLGKAYNDKKGTSLFYKEATFFSTQEVGKFLNDAGFENLVQNSSCKGAFVVVKGLKSGG